jgi:endonuclease/exonuclease/phosphatase family metal-dependent hydrolase
MTGRATGPASAYERIRIATWNCFGAPPTAEDFFAGRPFWPERLVSRAVVETLASYDIVCVQENLVDRVREALEQLQRAARFSELWFDPMGPDLEDGTFVGGGLAILSRWPIRVRFERLPRGAGPDGFARKGFALADIELPSHRFIHVVNTHLQADDLHVPAELCREARAAQLAGLARAVASLRETGNPVVLCGDLNVAFGTDEYEEVRRQFGSVLADLTANAGLSSYDAIRNDLAKSFYSGGPKQALFDYIWASAPFELRDIRTILDEPIAGLGAPPPPHTVRPFASDHFGIGATLHLRIPTT